MFNISSFLWVVMSSVSSLLFLFLRVCQTQHGLWTSSISRSSGFNPDLLNQKVWDEAWLSVNRPFR